MGTIGAGEFSASGEFNASIITELTVPLSPAVGVLNWQLTPAGSVPGHENLIADGESVTPEPGVSVNTTVLPVVAPGASVSVDDDAAIENPPVYWMAGAEPIAAA
jgi:hypothetical protein